LLDAAGNQNIDGLPSEFNTPGSVHLHSHTDGNGGFDGGRLTPMGAGATANAGGNGTGQSGGESLYTKLIESVLGFLNSSNLLGSEVGAGDDEDSDDSPIVSPTGAGAGASGGAKDRSKSPASLRSTGVLSPSVSAPSTAGPGGRKRAQAAAAAAAASAAVTAASAAARHRARQFGLTAENFPAPLIASNGNIVRTLIRQLSGKAVPTVASKKKASWGNRDKGATTISLQSNLSSTTNYAATTALADEQGHAGENRASAVVTPSSTMVRASFGGGRAGSAASQTAAAAAANKVDEALYITLLDLEELLIFLKSQGALLGSVKPWHLLGWSTLNKLLLPGSRFTELGVTASMTPGAALERQRNLERDYPRLSRAGWLKVLLQVIKVFVLSRITVPVFKSLPGMSATQPCMSWTYRDSNIYTVSEGVLLEWLSFHYNRSATLATQQKLLLDFVEPLRDGLVLGQVLAAHVPSLGTGGSKLQLRTNPVSLDDCAFNLGRVLLTLEDLGIPYLVPASSLVSASETEMVLFVSFLFERLPAFVPRSTLLFKGALGAKEDMVQCVELSNPSSTRALHYAIAIEAGGPGGGAADFRTDSNTITLQPRGKSGSTVKVPVRCRPRFSRSVEARLVFTASSPAADAPGGGSAGPASTLVFTLKTAVTSRQPLASYSASTRTYEPAAVDVRFTNPFNQDCTFMLSVKLDQEPAVSKNANAADDGGKSSARGSAARMVTAARSASASRGVVASGGPVGALPPVFFSPFERVRLRAGETVSLPVQFLPLRVGHYRAQMVLLDESVGEVMLELRGEATAPAPVELFKWTTSLARAGGSESKEIQLSFKNMQIEAARQACFERLRNLSRQQRDLKKARPDWNSQTLRPDLLPTGGAVLYNTTVSSPFFQVPAQLLLSDVKLDKDNILLTKGGGGNSGNSGAGGRGTSGALGVSRRGTVPGGPAIITDLTGTSPGGPAAPGAASNAGGSPVSNKSSAAALGYNSSRGNVSENRFLLAFNPRGAGTYRAQVVLTSSFDVRTYALEVTVLADDAPPALEFVAAARQQVTQSIPLTNNSAEMHVYKASLSGAKGFTGPAEVIVSPHSTAAYPLSFAPSWVCQASGTLVLSNAKTDEKHTFALSGTGTEPLAEAHLALSMAARSTRTHKVSVPNTSSATDVYFTVECDLPSFRGAPSSGAAKQRAKGEKETFRVAAGDTGEYSFVLAPSVSGVERGALSFVTPDRKSFVWYGLEVTVAPPEAEDELAVSAPARGAVQIQVPVRNDSSDKVLRYDVSLEGAEGLFGPSSIEVAPNSTAQYEFVYSPLRATSSSGEPLKGALRFSSAENGEVWHQLLLTATLPAEEVVDFGSETQVGSSAERELELENPLDVPLVVRASVVSGRDARCFVVPKPFTSVSIPPLSRGLVRVRYTPSRIGGGGDDDAETAKIVFASSVVADFVFVVRGAGARPSTLPPSVVSAALDTRVSRTLPFRNPFAQRISVDVELRTTGEAAGAHSGSPSRSGSATSGGQPHSTFHLLLKRTQALVVPPFSILQIPFLFAPRSVAPHRAAIVVRAESEQQQQQGAPPMEWTFPLEGEAEGQTSSEAPLALTCLARERVEDEWTLRLGGLDAFAAAAASSTGANLPLSVTVESDNDAHQALLLRSLQLALVPSGSASSAEQRVRYVFRPLVPVKATGFVVVSRGHGGGHHLAGNDGAAVGGRWRFPLSVMVAPPAADDTIKIESLVGSTSSVAFRLHNFKDTPSPFTAGLSLESAAEFSIYPRSGVLPPRGQVDPMTGQEGTQFVVSFSPSEFAGKPAQGQVHVRAGDDMCWTYNLVGAHPKYEAPKAVAPTVHTRNDAYHALLAAREASLAARGGKPVNHVSANIRALKDVPILADKVSKVHSWKGTGATNSAAIAASVVQTFPTPPTPQQRKK
jgi:hypothetical protein